MHTHAHQLMFNKLINSIIFLKQNSYIIYYTLLIDNYFNFKSAPISKNVYILKYYNTWL